MNIRINPETHSRLALCAKQKGFYLNSLISTSLD
ncbi:MAG: toxin-antitoxin system HicB family antitoxin [Bacteroidales bacterium]|nr:toxin-antitoxin system HicB family antitoxin [Candidatus Hennigimonas equi]